MSNIIYKLKTQYNKMKNFIVAKVRKQGEAKVVNIAKKSNIEADDFVIIKKVEDIGTKEKLQEVSN